MDTDQLIAPDLVLLLLAAPTRWEEASNRINGITRLEKLLFMASKECDLTDVSDAFSFKPYHYGPYSRAIYEAVEILEEAGLISETRLLMDSALDSAEELSSDTTTELAFERRFVLTEDGTAVATYLANSHQQLERELGELKDRYAKLSLQSLIRYVYNRYPDYADSSLIRDKVI